MLTSCFPEKENSEAKLIFKNLRITWRSWQMLRAKQKEAEYLSAVNAFRDKFLFCLQVADFKTQQLLCVILNQFFSFFVAVFNLILKRKQLFLEFLDYFLIFHCYSSSILEWRKTGHNSLYVSLCDSLSPCISLCKKTSLWFMNLG